VYVQDFDRLITPSKLVTTGPYRWMQHPIYTSYMLLFASFCFAMHTAPTAAAVLVVCMLYYRLRCSLERDILAAAFGKEYDLYASRTKKFIPGLM
jgi:protein-S-isoprenylcysteine O-methyltransferase Ste14